jgi:hypothetical protein
MSWNCLTHLYGSFGNWAVQRCLEAASTIDERRKIVQCMRSVSNFVATAPAALKRVPHRVGAALSSLRVIVTVATFSKRLWTARKRSACSLFPSSCSETLHKLSSTSTRPTFGARLFPIVVRGFKVLTTLADYGTDLDSSRTANLHIVRFSLFQWWNSDGAPFSQRK